MTPPRSRAVTMSDVAQAAGVSRATVSLVVRDAPQIPDETKQRVRAAITRLGYVYDHRAAAMRAKRTMTAALVITDVRNPFFAELTMAIETQLRAAGFALLIGYSLDDRAIQHRVLEVMLQRRVDGVLLLPARETTAADLRWRSFAGDTPQVLLARRVAGSRADYVGIDNIAAGRLLGVHLAQRGHTRVAFAGGPEGASSREERCRGLSEGLAAEGVTFDPELSIASSVDRAGGAAAVEGLLPGRTAPDAIVFYNDVIAFGGMNALRAAGLEPGSEISVGSFDDVPEAALQHPPLTSVGTRADRVGTEAARLLIERLGEPGRRPAEVLVEPALEVRASSTTSGAEPTAGSAAREVPV